MPTQIIFHCGLCGRYWPEPPDGLAPCVIEHLCFWCRRDRLGRDYRAAGHPERRDADRRTDPPGLGGVEGLDRRHGDRRDG